jgi:hypothetical protein
MQPRAQETQTQHLPREPFLSAAALFWPTFERLRPKIGVLFQWEGWQTPWRLRSVGDLRSINDIDRPLRG